MPRTNSHGQRIGEEVDDWTIPPTPPPDTLVGRTVTLQPLDPGDHGPELFSVFENAPESLWTYMSFGPFEGYRAFQTTLEAFTQSAGWFPYAISVSGRPLGFASYLRIAPHDGSLEIGSITFSPQLQQTTPATDALYLMMRYCFALGYRRCEWKCDSLNEPSRQAAERLGFRFEGVFRQATVYKGRNRDTAWYAITDREWPELESAFQRWLAPDNFDGDGQQRRTLRQMREGNLET